MVLSAVAPHRTKVEFTLGRTLLWLGIATLFTTLQIQQSLNSGNLLFRFLIEDDAMYYSDGLYRLHLFQQYGLLKLFRNYAEIRPHSPVSTLFALIGFAVFGLHDWAPSAARGLVIFGIILFIAEYLCRGLNLMCKLLIVALVLTWPILGVTVTEGRPDMSLGLLLAVGILLVTESSWLKSNWQKQVIAGAFFGAAFVCKPSMSPITSFLLVTTLLTASLIDILRDKMTRQNLLPANTYCLATALAVMSPYYLIHGRSAVIYFTNVIWGKGSEVWHLDLSLVDHALYYIRGAGGEWLIGYSWLGLTILLSLICLFLVLKTNYRNLRKSFSQKLPVSLGVMIILTWLVLSIPKTKSPYFGATLAGLLLLTTVQMLVFLIRQFQNSTTPKYRFGLWLGSVALLGFAWGQFRWPFAGIDREKWLNAYNVTEKIALDVRSGIPFNAKVVEFSRSYLTIAGYHILKRRAGKDYDFPEYDPSFYNKDLTTNLRLLETADYVIIETDTAHLKWTLAYPQLPTLLAEVQSPRFRLWREYPDYLSDKGGKIRIYQRVVK